MTFPLEFVSLHSTNRKADDTDVAERKLNEINADQTCRHVIGNRLLATLRWAAWEKTRYGTYIKIKKNYGYV